MILFPNEKDAIALERDHINVAACLQIEPEQDRFVLGQFSQKEAKNAKDAVKNLGLAWEGTCWPVPLLCSSPFFLLKGVRTSNPLADFSIYDVNRLRMKYLYAWCLLIIVFLTAGCEQEEFKRGCNVLDPVQEIKWLHERVEELKTSSNCQFVQQGKYNGHSVFVLGSCDANVNSINAVYDCEGNLLCFNGDETCPNFNQEVTDLKIIWTNQE